MAVSGGADGGGHGADVDSSGADGADAERPTHGADSGSARTGPEPRAQSADDADSLFSVKDPGGASLHVGPSTSPIAVFDAEAEEAEERFLGDGGSDNDAAMKAFFEADFDDGRYGR